MLIVLEEFAAQATILKVTVNLANCSSLWILNSNDLKLDSKAFK